VVYPLLVLANLIGRENVVLNTISFSAIFLLLVSLTGKNSNSRCSRRA
jgi:hypothetical protein